MPYRDEPAILGWSLFNEPRCPGAARTAEPAGPRQAPLPAAWPTSRAAPSKPSAGRCSRPPLALVTHARSPPPSSPPKAAWSRASRRPTCCGLRRWPASCAPSTRTTLLPPPPRASSSRTPPPSCTSTTQVRRACGPLRARGHAACQAAQGQSGVRARCSRPVSHARASHLDLRCPPANTPDTPPPPVPPGPGTQCEGEDWLAISALDELDFATIHVYERHMELRPEPTAQAGGGDWPNWCGVRRLRMPGGSRHAFAPPAPRAASRVALPHALPLPRRPPGSCPPRPVPHPPSPTPPTRSGSSAAHGATSSGVIQGERTGNGGSGRLLHCTRGASPARARPARLQL
jgi:hypothetical protein